MTLTTLLALMTPAMAVPLMLWCHVLSRRLRRLNDLETGLGGAIAVMSAEIDRLDASVRRARAEAGAAAADLTRAIERAAQEKAILALQAGLPAAPGARRLRPRSGSGRVHHG
ncbi:MAG: hypothetical protein Q4G25_08335 [Paracoccus sp. (in: a-proteobacteria)]|nr:hypothetical protein [Paracoccus sp. (in: a-proteobacteria)]